MLAAKWSYTAEMLRRWRDSGCASNHRSDAQSLKAPSSGTSTVPEYWGNAPHPTLTGMGVTWLYGFQLEIKVIAKLPELIEA